MSDITTITDLWNPDIWVPAVAEQQATLPSLISSRAVTFNPTAQALADGPGEMGNIPFWVDPTDQADEIQVEDTAPSGTTLSAGLMKAVICNRVSSTGVSALAQAVTGQNVVDVIASYIAKRRLKQRQATMLAILRGAFHSGTGSAADNGNGALKAMRYDNFDETGESAQDTELMGVDMFIDACAMLGELEQTLYSGAMWVHPVVLAGLKKADENNYIKASEGSATMPTYRGIPLYESSALVRAGGTNGYVYETYLLGAGVVARGERAQSSQVGQVASLVIDEDAPKNNATVIDRTRFVLHLNGMKWVGSIQGQSPTNDELQAYGNWNLALSSASRVGAVCIRTNG